MIVWPFPEMSCLWMIFQICRSVCRLIWIYDDAKQDWKFPRHFFFSINWPMNKRWTSTVSEKMKEHTMDPKNKWTCKMDRRMNKQPDKISEQPTKKLNEWVNRQINNQTKGPMDRQMTELSNEWANKRTSEQTNEWTNQ